MTEEMIEYHDDGVVLLDIFTPTAGLLYNQLQGQDVHITIDFGGKRMRLDLTWSDIE